MNSSQRQPRSRIFDPESSSDRPLTPTRSISPLPQVQVPQFQPQKLKHVLHNAQQNTPLVNCHYHPDQVIQNFCKNLDCLLPLCPACVTIHQEDHNDQEYVPHFDLLGSCLAEQYNKIVDVCNLQAEDIENIVELKTQVKSHREVQKKKFLEAKEQFYKTIDLYMQSLENSLNAQSIKSTELLLSEINQFHRLQYDRWDDMHRRLQKLNSDKCLRTLIKCYKQSRPEDVYHSQHQLTINFIDRVKRDLEQVEVNPNKLQIILNELQSYISIRPEEPLRETTQQRPIQRVVRTSSQQQPSQHVSHSPIPTRVLQGFPIMQKVSPVATVERVSMPQMPPLPTGYPTIMSLPQGLSQGMIGLPQGFQGMPQGITGLPQGIPGMPLGMPGMPQGIPGMPQGVPGMQLSQLPTYQMQGMMGMHPQAQSMIQPQQYIQQPQQQQFQQYQPQTQQAAAPPQPKKQPLTQVQENQQEPVGQVIDLKSSSKPMGMAQKYYNKLFNDTDFSPSIDKY